VEHDGPRILDCHVQQNEAAVAALLEKSRELDRLALEQGSKLTQLFAIAESHDLQGDWKIYPPSGVKLRPSERRYKPYIVVLLVRYRLGNSRQICYS
jgi:hypothetical protein